MPTGAPTPQRTKTTPREIVALLFIPGCILIGIGIALIVNEQVVVTMTTDPYTGPSYSQTGSATGVDWGYALAGLGSFLTTIVTIAWGVALGIRLAKD